MINNRFNVVYHLLYSVFISIFIKLKIKKKYGKFRFNKKRGWKFSYEFNNEMKFEKGDVWKDDGQGASLHVKNNIVKLITTDKDFNQDGPNCSVKFNGECNTMEEFDMTCRMVKIRC